LLPVDTIVESPARKTVADWARGRSRERESVRVGSGESMMATVRLGENEKHKGSRTGECCERRLRRHLEEGEDWVEDIDALWHRRFVRVGAGVSLGLAWGLHGSHTRIISGLR
jgi:hypothetical protein